MEMESHGSVRIMKRRLSTKLRASLCGVYLLSTRSTRGDDDDHSALLSAYHHDLETVSEILRDGKSVFSGTGMPGMSDSAWLAIKIKAETPKGETSTEAQSFEPLQRDVDNSLVTVSFSLDEETIQQICSNPNPETALQCDRQTTTCRSESVDVVS